MRYTIRIREQIPEFVTVQGVAGLENIRNNLAVIPNPPSFRALLYSDLSGIHGDDPTKRVELWDDLEGTATDAEVFSACPGLRDFLAYQIRLIGDKKLKEEVAKPYLDGEQKTWPQQQKEAEGYPNIPTPMINAMAWERRISVFEMIAKIKENADKFPAASGTILGIQQRLLDQIYATQSVDELFSVVWPQ